MADSSIRIDVAGGDQAKLATDLTNGIHTLKTTEVSGLGTSGVTITDASIASAAGSSETIAAASATRSVLNVSNPGTTSWWINASGGAAAANAAGSFELPPGGRWCPRPAPVNVVKGIGTASSKLTVEVG